MQQKTLLLASCRSKYQRMSACCPFLLRKEQEQSAVKAICTRSLRVRCAPVVCLTATTCTNHDCLRATSYTLAPDDVAWQMCGDATPHELQVMAHTRRRECKIWMDTCGWSDIRLVDGQAATSVAHSEAGCHTELHSPHESPEYDILINALFYATINAVGCVLAATPVSVAGTAYSAGTV